MKKYLLFCFDYYYPMGGISDFKGSSDSLDEVRAMAESVTRRGPDVQFSHADIIDRDTLACIWSNNPRSGPEVSLILPNVKAQRRPETT